MCRMLAKVSLKKTSIVEEMKRSSHSLYWLSIHGRKSHDPLKRGRHQDGGGLAFVDKKQIVLHKRGRDDFWDKSYAQTITQARSHFFIAHVRDASQGLVTNANAAHPFVLSNNKTSFALCHNGSVQSFMKEARKAGTSDSEIFLRKIFKDIKDDSEESIFRSVAAIARKTSYSSLCAFLLTADHLCAWRIFNDTDRNNRERYQRYYTLYLKVGTDQILLASEPLDDDPWCLLPNWSFLSIYPDKNSLRLKLFPIGRV